MTLTEEKNSTRDIGHIEYCHPLSETPSNVFDSQRNFKMILFISVISTVTVDRLVALGDGAYTSIVLTQFWHLKR